MWSVSYQMPTPDDNPNDNTNSQNHMTSIEDNLDYNSR
jgi:hypothetical protein